MDGFPDLPVLYITISLTFALVGLYLRYRPSLRSEQGRFIDVVDCRRGLRTVEEVYQLNLRNTAVTRFLSVFRGWFNLPALKVSDSVFAESEVLSEDRGSNRMLKENDDYRVKVEGEGKQRVRLKLRKLLKGVETNSVILIIRYQFLPRLESIKVEEQSHYSTHEATFIPFKLSNPFPLVENLIIKLPMPGCDFPVDSTGRLIQDVQVLDKARTSEGDLLLFLKIPKGEWIACARYWRRLVRLRRSLRGALEIEKGVDVDEQPSD